MTLRLGVLVSGSGSNLQSILDEVSSGRLDAEIRLVISNVPGARALQRAEDAGVDTMCIDHHGFESRRDFDTALRDALLEAGVEWVVLAGFMRLLTDRMLGTFDRRILNIHPALLPSFPGTNAPRQAVEKGVTISGCTIHIVDSGTDTGPILAQAAVPVLANDDAATLGARIQKQEHRLYPTVLQWIAEGRLRWDGDKPRLADLPPGSGVLCSPPMDIDGNSAMEES